MQCSALPKKKGLLRSATNSFLVVNITGEDGGCVEVARTATVRASLEPSYPGVAIFDLFAGDRAEVKVGVWDRRSESEVLTECVGGARVY